MRREDIIKNMEIKDSRDNNMLKSYLTKKNLLSLF